MAPSVETKTGERACPCNKHSSSDCCRIYGKSFSTCSFSSYVVCEFWKSSLCNQSATVAPQENPSVGASTFNAGSHAPASRSTDVAVQPKTFVDVSSHNGGYQCRRLSRSCKWGVGGVVLSVTKTRYNEIKMVPKWGRNAQAVGLQFPLAFSLYNGRSCA